MGSSVHGRVSRFRPAWRKGMTITIRSVSTIVLLVCKRLTPWVKYGGVLRWAGLADAPFFDLHQCDTAACATPLEPMYDTLLRYNPLDGGKTIIPDLAYKWEVSSDGLTYTLPPARRGHVP